MIKDMCILKRCHATMTTSSTLPCIPERNSVSANTKVLPDEIVGRNFFRVVSLSQLMPLHVPCFNIHTDTPWYFCCMPFIYSECGVQSICDRTRNGMMLRSAYHGEEE